MGHHPRTVPADPFILFTLDTSEPTARTSSLVLGAPDGMDNPSTWTTIRCSPRRISTPSCGTTWSTSGSRDACSPSWASSLSFGSSGVGDLPAVVPGSRSRRRRSPRTSPCPVELTVSVAGIREWSAGIMWPATASASASSVRAIAYTRTTPSGQGYARSTQNVDTINTFRRRLPGVDGGEQLADRALAETTGRARGANRTAGCAEADLSHLATWRGMSQHVGTMRVERWWGWQTGTTRQRLRVDRLQLPFRRLGPNDSTRSTNASPGRYRFGGAGNLAVMLLDDNAVTFVGCCRGTLLLPAAEGGACHV